MPNEITKATAEAWMRKTQETLERLNNELQAMPQPILYRLNDYHNYDGSLGYCLRWGAQAAQDLIPVVTKMEDNLFASPAESEIASFEAILMVEDAKTLFGFAKSICGHTITSLNEAICEGVVNPENSPVDTGFEIISKSVITENAISRLQVQCRIFDSEKMFAEADARYAACCGGDEIDDCEREPGKMLYEILVASNANPSANDCGFALIDYVAVGNEVKRENSEEFRM